MIGSVAGEDVVFVGVELDGVVGEVEGTEGAHVGGAEAGVGVEDAVWLAPATAGDHIPREAGELREGLIGLAAEDDVGAGLR